MDKREQARLIEDLKRLRTDLDAYWHNSYRRGHADAINSAIKLVKSIEIEDGENE